MMMGILANCGLFSERKNERFYPFVKIDVALTRYKSTVGHVVNSEVLYVISLYNCEEYIGRPF